MVVELVDLVLKGMRARGRGTERIGKNARGNEYIAIALTKGSPTFQGLQICAEAKALLFCLVSVGVCSEKDSYK